MDIFIRCGHAQIALLSSKPYIWLLYRVRHTWQTFQFLGLYNILNIKSGGKFINIGHNIYYMFGNCPYNIHLHKADILDLKINFKT